MIEKADHPLEENTASALAAAAIRYYLLKFTLESQIVFDFDEALKTTGDTGVYLEYAHARACSILRKAGRAEDRSSMERRLYSHPIDRDGKRPSGCPVKVFFCRDQNRQNPEGFSTDRICL